MRRGDSAVHAYGVERRRYRLGLPPSFPSVGLRFPFIDATNSQREEPIHDQ